MLGKSHKAPHGLFVNFWNNSKSIKNLPSLHYFSRKIQILKTKPDLHIPRINYKRWRNLISIKSRAFCLDTSGNNLVTKKPGGSKLQSIVGVDHSPNPISLLTPLASLPAFDWTLEWSCWAHTPCENAINAPSLQTLMNTANTNNKN